MANGWYNKALDLAAQKGWDFINDTIKAQLVDTAQYTVDLANHDYLDDVPAGARVGTAVTLGTKSVTGGGVLDAADVTFTAVTGNSIEAIVIYDDTPAAEGAKPLLLYIDTNDASQAISITPNGGNIDVSWDNGANKIAKL